MQEYRAVDEWIIKLTAVGEHRPRISKVGSLGRRPGPLVETKPESHNEFMKRYNDYLYGSQRASSRPVRE